MSCSTLLIGCLVVGVKVMVMCWCGLGCTWPLLLFEQPNFENAFIDHMCIGEVGPVLMMKPTSLTFLWSKFYTLVCFLFCWFYFWFWLGHNDDQC